MGDLAQEIAQHHSAHQMPRRPLVEHPKGWEPGVVWHGTRGEITSRPVENQDPRWDTWLQSWGFDPRLFRIVEPVQVRTWEAVVGNGETKQLWYYKAQIEARPEGHDAVDVEALIREVQRYKPPKRPPPSGSQAFVVAVSDPQLGKADGDGTLGTIQRITEKIEAARDRLSELRRIGREIGTVVLADVGDGIENVCGNYPTQAFTVELTLREQNRVHRRLLTRAIARLAPLVPDMRVVAVPSNHAQNRQDGKQITPNSDDYGLSNMECVAEAFSQNPAFSHVTFVIPDDEMEVVLDVCGTAVAFTHMHQAGGSGTPQKKALEWWKGQSFGGRPAGDARVLVSGHYHHLMVTEHTEGRTHIQCPKLDGGSDYFRNATGVDSRPGILTFVTGAGVDYQDLAVL